MTQTQLTRLAIREYHELLRKYNEANPLERLDLREQISSTSKWLKMQNIAADKESLSKSLLEANRVSRSSNN